MSICNPHGRLLPLMILLSLLCGCAVSGAPPVIDVYGQDVRAARVEQGTHRVQRGETLYSIAWRYGWDYRDLARANGIRAPYTIYPGQVIRFGDGGVAESGWTRVPVIDGVATPVAVSSSEPSPEPEPEPEKDSKNVASDNNTQPAPPSPAAAAHDGPLRWQWPADGPLLSTFGTGGAQGRGIAIGGRLGSPVLAAASGQVVYRGSGLTGYGKLIIIKHNDRWLSAYAHNQTITVQEGQQVKAGAPIATMGASGTYRTQLHFEIRKDGKPVNPLSVLPDR